MKNVVVLFVCVCVLKFRRVKKKKDSPSVAAGVQLCHAEVFSLHDGLETPKPISMILTTKKNA